MDNDTILYSVTINMPSCGIIGPWAQIISAQKITETETHFDIPNMPESVCDWVRIRVVATDGINSAEDVSDPFSFVLK